MPLHPLSHGTVSWIKYLSVAQFRVRAHARLLSCAQPNCTRTLIHPFTKRPPPPILGTGGHIAAVPRHLPLLGCLC